jgi:sulfate transport system permease protein
MSTRVLRVTPRRPGQLAVLGVVLVWLTVILVVPLGALTFTVVTHLGETVRTLLTPDALYALGQSILLAALALLVNGVFGVMGALVLVRQRFWGRRVLDALVDLPLAVSPVMTGLAFLLMFGRQGSCSRRSTRSTSRSRSRFRACSSRRCSCRCRSPCARSRWCSRRIGTSEEESAATLGASPLQSFFYVTLPNIRNGLSLGATLTVARALGEFGAVLVLGGAIAGATQTATTYIYVAMEERQVAGAYGMALLLAASAAGLLVLLQKRTRRREPWGIRVSHLSKSFGSREGRRRRELRGPAGRARGAPRAVGRRQVDDPPDHRGARAGRRRRGVARR